MAERDDTIDAPPAGEQIHMPAPSIIPVLNAAGLSTAIIGITISIVLVIGGLVLFFGDRDRLDPRRPAGDGGAPARARAPLSFGCGELQLRALRGGSDRAG